MQASFCIFCSKIPELRVFFSGLKETEAFEGPNPFATLVQIIMLLYFLIAENHFQSLGLNERFC